MRRHLEQVLASDDFDASRRSREFLRFIVEVALAGRGETLTQTELATRVFGRKDDFDPVVDPIVRIQAGRLRRSLERYYLLSGQADPVRIELPRGGYAPAFRHAPAAPAAPPPATAAVAGDDWPSIVVQPFAAIAAAAEVVEVAARVKEALVLELSLYRDVRVTRQSDLDQARLPQQVRFVLGGALRPNHAGWQVGVHLVDRSSGEQVWADAYHTTPGPERWSGSPEEIARVIAARVGAEEGIVVQTLAAEHRKRPAAEAGAYGAILRSYDFFLARDAALLVEAIQALRRLVAATPDCGLAWTRLARLCLADHAFEITPAPPPVEQAVACAQVGVRLDPSGRRARCVLASTLLVKGELAAARKELDEALRLTHDSLLYLEIIGFQLTLAGDFERGHALSRAALQRNPHCLPHVLFGVWADSLRRGELEAAHQAALAYRDPTHFWRPVMRAACLGHLGRAADARPELDELLRAKPEFQASGRRLVGHYLKLPELADPVVEGLAKAGLPLA